MDKYIDKFEVTAKLTKEEFKERIQRYCIKEGKYKYPKPQYEVVYSMVEGDDGKSAVINIQSNMKKFINIGIVKKNSIDLDLCEIIDQDILEFKIIYNESDGFSSVTLIGDKDYCDIIKNLVSDT